MPLQHLVGGVELVGPAQVGEIAGVDDEVRPRRQRVDLGHRGAQALRHVRVRGLVEADVAVADLDEEQALAAGHRAVRRCARWQRAGLRDAGVQAPEQAGAGPGHALEEAAAVDAVVRRLKRLIRWSRCGRLRPVMAGAAWRFLVAWCALGRGAVGWMQYRGGRREIPGSRAFTRSPTRPSRTGNKRAAAAGMDDRRGCRDR